MQKFVSVRSFCRWGLLAAIVLLVVAACQVSAETPVALSTRAPTQAAGTPGTSGAPAATATPGPSPTPSPTPIQLVVCQPEEPLSLYLYGDDTSARRGIFQALFDGPIDATGYAYQPVILESLPSFDNGGVTMHEVEVRPGESVIDGLTGEVRPLADGVQLKQVDGSLVVYSGTVAARTVQTTAVFNIKTGVRWSDGQPVTADDSVFSFEIAANPATLKNKIFVDRTARYEAVDTYTVRWTGLPGWGAAAPGWLDNDFFLRFWTPLPRHLYGKLSAAELLANPDANERPLGWGPFMLGAWVKGNHLTLIRNPYYFRTAEGLPRIDLVTFRFGLSPEKILEELKAGRCDIGAADFGAQVPLLLAAQKDGWLAPQFVSAREFEALDFGIQPVEDYQRPAGDNLFKEPAVRQAFAYCLDRKTLVNTLLNGLAEVPNTYVPAAHPLYAADRLTTYPFDPVKGRAVLDTAGWTDKNNDGLREKGNLKLSVEYASGPAGDPFREALAQFLQTQLRDQCGIEIRPKLYAPDQIDTVLYGIWPNGVLFGRKFDLGGFPWQTGAEPPCALYLTESIASDQNPGGANDTGYSNPAFDAACRAALTAPDAATRKAKQAEAQIILAQDLPSLPLFFYVRAGAALPRVRGFQLDSTAESDLWNIEQIGFGQ